MVTSPPHPERSKEMVGFRLRTLREALKLSAKDMCAAVTVEQNTWSQWENGKRLADLTAMSRLWDRFGATLEYIYLGRTETLPFELAMKVREKLAASSVGTSRADTDLPIAAKVPEIAQKEPARKTASGK